MLIDRRVVLGSGLGLVVPVGATRAAGRHVLVMVETTSCIYCIRWHQEVGPGYTRSAEGAFAPLQRLNLGDPGLSHIKNLRYTPTFVLLDGEREIGRIVGYPGADFFWGLLADLLAKAGFPTSEPSDIKT